MELGINQQLFHLPGNTPEDMANRLYHETFESLKPGRVFFTKLFSPSVVDGVIATKQLHSVISITGTGTGTLAPFPVIRSYPPSKGKNAFNAVIAVQNPLSPLSDISTTIPPRVSDHPPNTSAARGSRPICEWSKSPIYFNTRQMPGSLFTKSFRTIDQRISAKNNIGICKKPRMDGLCRGSNRVM
jgi:hypothetical protein